LNFLIVNSILKNFDKIPAGTLKNQIPFGKSDFNFKKLTDRQAVLFLSFWLVTSRQTRCQAWIPSVNIKINEAVDL